MNLSHKLGRAGEELAADYLEKLGYQIIIKNLYTPYGEIDLVVKKNKLICFVEVKSRSTEYFGSPADAVNYKKQERIRKSALWWLQERGCHYDEIRFDVVGILCCPKKTEKITYWPGGFE